MRPTALAIVWLWFSLGAAQGAKTVCIVPYVGYGNTQRLVATGRVLEPQGLRRPRGAWDRLVNNAKRLLTDEQTGVPIVVRAGAAIGAGKTDREGFYRIELRPPKHVAPADGFVEGVVQIGPGAPYSAPAAKTRFVVPSGRTRFAVISDVDDTVLITNVLDKSKLLLEAALGDAATRRAFAGAAEFYQALRAGADRDQANPIFYVSASPWNIYDLLVDAFRRLRVPLGRFELRDLGIGKQADPLFDIKRFKRGRITRLFAFYPQLKFVLIGDSGQADAELYAELATHAHYRGRIIAVYIRNVNPPTGPRQQQLAAWRERVGERFVVFDNSHVAAVDAARRGLIAESSLRAIQKAASLSGSLQAGKGTRCPIVLAHGLLGFNKLGLEGFAAITYFRGIADHLRAHGYRVLLTEVGKTDGVATRAAQLKMGIQRATAGKVNIIAHSMGGLDARYMIAHLGMADQVASLTTIGTPHRGSSFADWGIAHFGDSSRLLQALGVGTAAFYDLTTQACAHFNECTPNAPNVRYYSFSGTQSRNHIYGALQFSYDIIRGHEGPNDGLVSQRSARWGRYLGNLDADHLNEVGWKFPWERGETFDAKAFYLKLAEMLRDEGF